MTKSIAPMKYITRLGNGWTVRVAIPKTKGEDYIYSRFLDRDYTSKEAALVAAKKQRDHDAKLIGADKKLVRQKRRGAKQDLITGLSEVRTVECHKNGSDYLRCYIIAHHPENHRGVRRKFMYKDNPIKSNSRTRKEAIKLAEKVRRKWEKEAGMIA
tara:strand:- start:1193 stop:1663 length:471 start_codon:yes stop_codon:yes gene_type:complete